MLALVAVGQTSLGFDDFLWDLGLEALDVPTSSNSYGVELSWQLSVLCLGRLGWLH